MPVSIQYLSFLFSVASILVATLTYHRNMRLKRAEWLRSLFEKFYETERYKAVRFRLDNPEALQKQGLEEEMLVDYLNFFEFIASLHKLGQIRKEEVLMLFRYYLKLIENQGDIRTYIAENGFGNLDGLLKDLKKKGKILNVSYPNTCSYMAR